MYSGEICSNIYDLCRIGTSGNNALGQVAFSTVGHGTTSPGTETGSLSRRRFFLSVVYGAIMATVIGVFSLTPIADRMEHRYGLALLYWLRGPVAPPQGAIIVSVDKQTTAWLRQISRNPQEDHKRLIGCLPESVRAELGQLRGPGSLPRSVYACLLDELRRHGFPVVAVDVLFSIEGAEEDDAALATALSRHGGTILLVRFERSKVDVEGAEVLVERELQPHRLFRENAAATGSFLVPRAGGPPYGHWRSVPGFAGSKSLADHASDLMRTRRPDARPKPKQQQSSFSYLWIYGPAGSVVTVRMSDVLRGAIPASVLASATDTAVFVGASDPNTNDYIDLLPSFFDGRFGPNISGVELAATAFLNMLRGHDLHRLSPPAEAALILLFAFAIGMAARAVSSYAIFAFPVIAAVSVMAASALFNGHQLLLPVSTLVFVALPAAFLVAVLVRYRFARTLIMRLAPAPVAQRLLKTSMNRRGVAVMTDATILFSDLIGSTKIGEQMSEMEFSTLLNTYYDTMTHEIEAHRGFVAAFSGDGMTAVFDSAECGSDHAVLACRAALSAVSEMESANRENAKKGYPALEMRIGINSGRVAEGEIGAQDRFNFSVVGDAVNVAARLEQMGKALFPGEKDVILIGSETRRMIEGHGLSLLDCGSHPISGRNAEEAVFRLNTTNDFKLGIS